jgi:hypothetical protein
MNRIYGRFSRVCVPQCARARIACAALALLAGALVPAVVNAVAARPASWQLVNADVPVVQDGVLLFRFDPGQINVGGVALAPMVTDSTGMVVPGSVEMLDIATGFAVYRFDAALGSGTFMVSDPASMLYNTPFTTTGPFVSDAPAAIIATTPGVQTQTLEQACCSGTTLISPFGPTAPACVVLRAAQYPQVFVTATLPANDSSSRQYLYRVVMTAPSEAEGAWRPASEAAAVGWSLATTDVGMEYCFRLEAHGLLDGETQVLDEQCVPRAQNTQGEVGPDEAAIAAALAVQGCLAPPAQLEAAWCEVNRSACTDPSDPSYSTCMQTSFDTICTDHPPSDDSLVDLVDMGASGTGAAGSNGGAGSGAMPRAGAAAEEGGRGGGAGTTAMLADHGNDAQTNDSGGGCSVAPHAGGSPAACLPWLAAAMVWAARRRRARHST